MLNKKWEKIRNEKIAKTRYAWPGTSFREFLEENQFALKNSNKAKMHREYCNRVDTYALQLSVLKSLDHVFKAAYSDGLTDALKKPTLYDIIKNKS